MPHRPGQHYVVRLTAPDGYTASRSYSVASAPDDADEIELTVERLEDGEVSTFLHDVVEVGDELEVRGPIGGWFVWDGETPALLVGGGSGVVPLMAMLRHARRTGRSDLVRLVVSVRSPSTTSTTRRAPRARVHGALHARSADRRRRGRRPASRAPTSRRCSRAAEFGTERDRFVCGSARFADAASRVLVDAGVPVDASASSASARPGSARSVRSGCHRRALSCIRGR